MNNVGLRYINVAAESRAEGVNIPCREKNYKKSINGERSFCLYQEILPSAMHYWFWPAKGNENNM